PCGGSDNGKCEVRPERHCVWFKAYRRARSIGKAFENFSICAQRLGVYTAQDYIEILKKLNEYWNVGSLRGLSDEAQRARDYLMGLPARLERISARMSIPEESYRFKWVSANGML
ncbi:MAG: methylenetetrahydrofolate reductase C-terminal domain-containing protein, partial [Robiginitalea sp.]|nr:methylenetetrahydrofolate reductase C-terminal domain-containing protein [Robiginitalea sp.]